MLTPWTRSVVPATLLALALMLAPHHERSAMNAKLFRVILQVDDLSKAEEFYGTVLDMDGVRVSPGRHYFDCGGTILACFDPRGDGDDFDSSPNSDYLYIAVADIDATYRLAEVAGMAFADGEVHGGPAGEVATRPWGERSFYGKDPFGNQICFVDASTIFTGEEMD